MKGTYFWASDMVLIDIASRERILEVIDYLLENDEFDSILLVTQMSNLKKTIYFHKAFLNKNFASSVCN
jgi:hypothetical protein